MAGVQGRTVGPTMAPGFADGMSAESGQLLGASAYPRKKQPSGACLTMAAPARVSRRPVRDRLDHEVVRPIGTKRGLRRWGRLQVVFQNSRRGLAASRRATDRTPPKRAGRSRRRSGARRVDVPWAPSDPLTTRAAPVPHQHQQARQRYVRSTPTLQPEEPLLFRAATRPAHIVALLGQALREANRDSDAETPQP